MAADYPAAQEHLVPRSFMFNSNDPKAIVIHKTGGDATPQAVYQTFLASGNPGKSSHYAIGQDGSIWQFVPEELGAGANGIPGPNIEAFWQPYLARYGNLNMCTISIEHCDSSAKNDTPLTPAQKQASFSLVAHLCQKYGIPADHIKPHRSIAATTCPGNYPMDDLIAYVRAGGDMMQLYTEQSKDFSRWFDPSRSSEHVWLCKNGKTLQYALKSLYQQLSLDGQTLPVVGLPLTGEQRITIKHRETGKDTEIVVQPCERCAALIYDPAHALDAQPGLGDAYLAHITDPRIAALIPGLTLTPEPAHAAIDTTAAESAIHAMVDGLAPLAARALVEVQKLRQ